MKSVDLAKLGIIMSLALQCYTEYSITQKFPQGCPLRLTTPAQNLATTHPFFIPIVFTFPRMKYVNEIIKHVVFWVFFLYFSKMLLRFIHVAI